MSDNQSQAISKSALIGTLVLVAGLSIAIAVWFFGQEADDVDPSIRIAVTLFEADSDLPDAELREAVQGQDAAVRNQDGFVAHALLEAVAAPYQFVDVSVWEGTPAYVEAYSQPSVRELVTRDGAHRSLYSPVENEGDFRDIAAGRFLTIIPIETPTNHEEVETAFREVEGWFQSQDGLVGSILLRREDGDFANHIVMARWESLEALNATIAADDFSQRVENTRGTVGFYQQVR